MIAERIPGIVQYVYIQDCNDKILNLIQNMVSKHFNVNKYENHYECYSTSNTASPDTLVIVEGDYLVLDIDRLETYNYDEFFRHFNIK